MALDIMALDKQLVDNDLCCLTDEDFYESKKLETRHSVDHICLSSHFKEKCSHIEVWYDSTLSDHNGVFMDLLL